MGKKMGLGFGVLIVGAMLTGPLMAAPEIPEAVRELEIRNVRLPADDLLTAGQLSKEQMAALKDLGYSTFINLRRATEEGTGWEEDYAREIGVDYVRIPVAGAAGMNQENMEALAESMESAAGKTVVYCASSNRVGGLLALKAHFIDEKSAAEALEFGLEAGLTSLEPKIRELLAVDD